VRVKSAEAANGGKHGLAIGGALGECASHQLACVACLLNAGEQFLGWDAVDGCVGEGEAHVAIAERGALHAIEGDHGQRRRFGRRCDLGLADKTGEDDEIRVTGVPGQPCRPPTKKSELVEERWRQTFLLRDVRRK
jgi:hypothetical protein